MLSIKAFMNTSTEPVLNFRTGCCGGSHRLFDLNLEIQVKNLGTKPVTFRSGGLELEGAQGVKRINALYPPGPREIGPEEIASFYCIMDETLWSASHTLTLLDSEGNRYRCPAGKD